MTLDSPAAQRFPIRIGRRSRPLLRLFGVRDGNAYVDVSETELDAQFGHFRQRTPLANIESWRIEGPWRWITAIGVRTSLRYRDLTFGGSPHGGVRINVREPLPWGPITIRALYLTVDDLDGLAAFLEAHGIRGSDGRKRFVP